MSKRRTRKDKLHARHVYSLPTLPSAAKSSDRPAPITESVRHSKNQLYAYDPNLLYRDLIKTVGLSVLILSLEFGLYWYWNL